MNEQPTRMPLNLNQVVTAYWKIKIESHEPRFTATELREFAQTYNFGTAPASADRVMRALRSKGVINFACINRGKSFYLALPLEVKIDAQN